MSDKTSYRVTGAICAFFFGFDLVLFLLSGNWLAGFAAAANAAYAFYAYRKMLAAK